MLFIGLVVVHEYGHFIMARRNGVDVEEFGIFFPPALYKRKTKAGWIFSLNLLPLGGFVRLKGEHDTDTEPGSFGAANLSAKNTTMVYSTPITGFQAMAVTWAGVGLEESFDIDDSDENYQPYKHKEACCVHNLFGTGTKRPFECPCDERNP